MRLSTAYNSYYRSWNPDLSSSSEIRHRSDIKRWQNIMGDRLIAEISTMDYQKFRSLSAQAGHSPETTETTLRTIRQTLNAVASHGQLATVPYAGRGRKLKRAKPRPATLDELAKLHMAAIAATWPRHTAWGPPKEFWRGWFAFAYWTGLRLSDLTWRLSLEHIVGNAIQFQASKTGIEHCYPVTDNLRRVLGKYHGDGSKPLFHCCHSPNMIRKHLRIICDAVEIRRLIPKHFRQASITQWTKASSRAGDICHGCGMPDVLNAYLDPLEIMEEAAPRMAWPFPV